MKISLWVTRQSAFYLLTLIFNQFLTSCTPAVSQALPPENYEEPVAEEPVLQPGDYWIYEMGNATRAKSTRLHPNLAFPLWVGKTWSYETEVQRAYLPPTSGGSTLRGQVDCAVKAVDNLTVKAGTFVAFRCECSCELLIGEGIYQSGCGAFTIWYAQDVKNVIQTKTASTSSSMELLQYKVSRLAPDAKASR
jgi:hypothetical protein